MRKLSTFIVSVILLLTLTLGLAACDLSWDVGAVNPGSSDTATDTTPDTPDDPDTDPEPEPPVKTPLELAIEEYNEKRAFLEGLTLKENYHFYTYASLSKLNAALADYTEFTPDGKTLEEIQEVNLAFDNAIALLVPAKDDINTRLDTAIAKLALYKTDSKGNVVYIDEFGEIVPKDTPGAKPLADKGVDKIVYDEETSTATFFLTESFIYAKPDDNGNMVECDAADPEAVEYYDIMLKNFVATNVLNIFDQDFSDIKSVSFNITVDKDYRDDDDTKEETFFTMTVGEEGGGGMYLAAGLLAVCAGYEQALYNAANYPDEFDLTSLLRNMQNYTYDIVKNKGCTATVYFENDKYATSAEFSIYFKA